MQPQQPGVVQDDNQGMAPAPGQRERPEVHLALAPRRRLEPGHRLDRLARPRRPHVVQHALVTALNGTFWRKVRQECYPLRKGLGAALGSLLGPAAVAALRAAEGRLAPIAKTA